MAPSEKSTGNGTCEKRVAKRVGLMRDGLVNCSEFVISGLAGLFLVPVMLRGLGAESYGLLLAGSTLAGMAAFLDCGLEWCVTREVAAAPLEAAAFVRSAGNAYLLVGFAGAVVIGFLGLPLSKVLRLSAPHREIAPLIFGLAGISFLADQALRFTQATLRGLGRFGAANGLSAAGILLRASGIVVLIATGFGVVGVAAWQAGASVVAAAAAIVAVGRMEPLYRLRPGRFDFNDILPHLPYGLRATFGAGMGALGWQSPPMILGMVGGAAWIAQYHVAQKFPLIILLVAGQMGGAFFPAACLGQRARDAARLREVLEVGTRWIVAVTLPLCLVLCIVAPDLLRIWVGEARPDMVVVLRLAAAATFLEAASTVAVEVLWAEGVTGTVFAVLAAVAVLDVSATALLSWKIGIAGAAWGILSGSALGLFAMGSLACRVGEISLGELIRGTSRGLLIPALASAVVTGLLLRFGAPCGCADLVGALLAGGAAYAGALYLVGSKEEERLFVSQAAGWLRRAAAAS